MAKRILIGLAVAALLLLPDAAGAKAGDGVAPEVAPVEMAGPPWHRWAAPSRTTRGGFVDFGARLNARAANGGATCRSATFPPNTFRSCTWESLIPGTNEAFFPPIGQGRITQVRIKAGNNTGPMRVVVLRALRVASTGAYVCCTARATSNTFTPRRNAVTTINVNLPVVQSGSPNPAGNYVDDHLALSVLGGNIVIPASIAPNASLGGWYPRWQVGQERTGAYGTSGAMILMRLRWRRN